MHEPGRLRVEEIELDEPLPGEVVVRMSAVGVCGTDLHSYKGEWDRPTPIVLGHEGAGRDRGRRRRGERAARGRPRRALAGRPRAASADRAGAAGRPPAGRFVARSARGTLLDGRTGISLGGETVYRGTATGALAERVVVAAGAAMPLGDDVPLEQAALLGCAALTGVGAVLNAARPEPGFTALVIGAGGVGQFVVQGARIAGAAEILVVDPVEARREQALAARRDARLRAGRRARGCARARPARASTTPSMPSVRRRRPTLRCAGRVAAARPSSSACRRPASSSSSTRSSSRTARRRSPARSTAPTTRRSRCRACSISSARASSSSRASSARRSRSTAPTTPFGRASPASPAACSSPRRRASSRQRLAQEASRFLERTPSSWSASQPRARSASTSAGYSSGPARPSRVAPTASPGGIRASGGNGVGISSWSRFVQSAPRQTRSGPTRSTACSR